MGVDAKLMSTNQESIGFMNVDAESSLKEIQITMPMIKCKWCKREKPCEEFDKYIKKKGYHSKCKDCRQLVCRFCGVDFFENALSNLC